MVAPDLAAHSETHRDSKEKEPVKLGLHANVNPDTLPFTYAKDKHVLNFTVENTGETMEIFKIKTTASYLYRIRPVFFKLGVRERQEVAVTFKGADAGPIPLSAKDRITVVFAHALDPRKSTSALWEMHKPYSHLSYAESREYVRVLFVDETGRLAVSAAQEKSRGGLEQRSVGGAGARSITMRPEPPRRSSVERDMTDNNNQAAADEKSNNAADNEAEAPPPPVQQQRPARTPRSPAAARTPGKSANSRTPSPNTRQSPKENRKSPARASARDPIESLLSSVTKDASAIVCVQYPGKGYKERDEGSTVEDEEKSRRDDKKDEDTTKKRDQDTEARREEVLRKKVEEMRRRDDEDKQRKKRDEERTKSAEEKKRREEEREERKKKEEEREERKKKEEEREERKKKEEDEAEAEEKAAAAAAAQKPRRTSNEEVKQEQAEESPRPQTPRRRVLGADGHYHDDDSRYLDEEIRRKQASVRLLKKGGRTASKDNSAEDDKPRRTSLEDDN